MKIVFDARMLGKGFGIGTYIKEILRYLPILGENHQWVILVRGESLPIIQELDLQTLPNVEIQTTEIKHYSLAEQTSLPKLLKSFSPDLVHFPNFNVPLFYRGPYTVTIHDLVHHHLPGHRRGRVLHRAAYRKIIKNAILKAEKVIAISKATKADILRFYPQVLEDKIKIVYEGVNELFTPHELAGEEYLLQEQYGIKKPYMLFVGVWEVKKNVPLVAKAFNLIVAQNPDLSLVLAGKEDPWHPEVKEQVKLAAGSALEKVIMPGFVEEEHLPALYRHAELFINASAFEGFGLPGLEAMACGTPVVVADTEVFREVYEEAALYFDSISAQDAALSMQRILGDKALADRFRERGLLQSKKYKWRDTVNNLIKIYHE